MKAVFLSYAREDAEAARRIADALRAFGVEVWFDQAELRGGDAWDAKIKKQIRECALFLPIISDRTQARAEGYFRREWKLAVERMQDMAASRAFLVPVVIDTTAEADAEVPEEFLRVQWTRLPEAVPSPQFVEQVKRLLEAPRKPAVTPKVIPLASDVGEVPPPGISLPRGEGTPPARKAWLAAFVVIAVGLGFWAFRPRSEPANPKPITQNSKPATDLASAKSIAVLPFANLSTEKENEFFADGVHDDVITNLAKIRDLKVISRTSVLAYRDTAARNLRKIAAELGVATVLEGSVRRVGTKVHMNAQLIDARTDEHLWAEAFDGDASDIFALQARLAREIAGALKATLTAGERTLIERRPTENQEAYELYLRAHSLHLELGERGTTADFERVVAAYERAIARDPAFALAHAQAAVVHSIMYWFGYLDPSPARLAKMKSSVDAAARFAPDAAETHLARGAQHYRGYREWDRALAEFRAAEVGLPNDAQLSFWLAITHRRLGKWSEAQEYFARSVALNPRDRASTANGAETLVAMRRYDEARRAIVRALGFFPHDRDLHDDLASAVFALDGDRAALGRALAAGAAAEDDEAQVAKNFLSTFVTGDLAAADRVLANARVESIRDSVAGVVPAPISRLRSYLAFVRGDHESARRFGDQAVAYYRSHTWNERQKAWVRMNVALARAYSGHFDEAVREGQAALADMMTQDAFDTLHLRHLLGTIYGAAGRRDDALACLRQMMGEPCFLSPNDFRIDPLWSRLKDDPRFEEILKAAKPL